MGSAVEKSALLRELLHRLGETIHHMQSERGAAGLFLDSLGKIFTKRYDARVKDVDILIADLQRFSEQKTVREALPPTFGARLGYLFDKYDARTELRDKVRLLSIRYTTALNRYTFELIVPTIDAIIELAHQIPEHNKALVSGYVNFLQWKERIGMQRALGTRGFYTQAFRNVEFRDRYIALIAEQRNYLNAFKALASPSQIGLVTENLCSRELVEFQSFNQLLEDGAPVSEVETYSGDAWFDLCTSIIDGLRETEKKLVDTLAGAAEHAAEIRIDVPNDTKKSATIPTTVQRYRKFLSTVTTFASMDPDDLDELLSFAQVHEYPKDKLLFMRDEPAKRVYVILQGWVKVYSSSDSGEEAIMQMIGAGETLLESSVFLNVPTPANAQVVEDALILSIPGAVIRERLQTNPAMALSMLNNVSIRTQRLVQQIELSRLKSAQERVGWFLLRLLLNQRSRDGLIYLPYEKSVIASYLDMRPETLSRTLKKFKQDGFNISADTIEIPDDNALCGFCDIDLATQCSSAGQDNCPHPEFSQDIYATDT